MKKRIISVLVCVVMLMIMMTGCAGGSESKESNENDSKKEGTAEEKDTYKVGITLQSLSNDYWAGLMSKFAPLLEEKGWEYTLVDCKESASTQVSQIENFITSGVDLIVVHPTDANGVEEPCRQALEQGIKVMCWDDPMENTTANWVLDNTKVGEEIGKTAAEFINEHYTADEKAKVTIIGYPSTKILLERGNGIKTGLEDNCKDNYEIVAEIDGLTGAESQTNVETVLAAHPDANVFVGIGAGSMIGSNEALISKYGRGKIPENIGVITADVTKQQLEALKAEDNAVRGMIGWEGSNQDTAEACVDLLDRILSGEDFSGDAQNVWRSTTPITLENADEILKGM